MQPTQRGNARQAVARPRYAAVLVRYTLFLPGIRRPAGEMPRQQAARARGVPYEDAARQPMAR